MIATDFIVIGAGIAGASTACFLARDASVIVLERESQPGYHTTGRSAALFAESYGTPQVRALTLASRGFLEHPPEGFTEHPLIGDRGALFVGGPGQEADLDALHATLRLQSEHLWRLDATETRVQVPVLEPGWVSGGVYDPLAADMDVHALHQGYLRAFRARGGRIVCDAGVTAMARTGECWRVTAGGRTFEAPVVVNAAGAWCDVIAALAGAAPIGLQPMRRSAFTFAPPADVDIRRWPAVIGVDESFYFKPDAGQLLGSPANADPVPPHDVRPEDEDIARGIERIETATRLRIRRTAHTWAGLRSFVADGDLVGGFDPVVPGFFWCAAQGGYGIQTSVAMGESCAALARGEGLPPRVERYGVTEAMLSPRRLARRAG